MSLAEFQRENHHNNFNTPWSPEAVRLLTQLWNDGIFAAKIAKELNERFGLYLTKSAITCKAGRLSLPPRRGHLSGEIRNALRRERMRQWRVAHREHNNEYRRKRRAFLRGLAEPGTFDPTKQRNIGNTPWVPQAVARLSELWLLNIRASEITKTLCAEFGNHFSHRAVLGKARRIFPPRPQIVGRIGHFRWLPGHLEGLTILWHEGLSATLIAKKMEVQYGRPFTRNSILGKARKLGLPNRPHGGSVAETDPVVLAARAELRKQKDRERKRSGRPVVDKEKYQKKIKLRAVAPQIEDWSIPTPQRKTLFALGAHDCRWPVGEPKSDQFFFCGAVAEENRPYCSSHCRRAYIETRSY